MELGDAPLRGVMPVADITMRELHVALRRKGHTRVIIDGGTCALLSVAISRTELTVRAQRVSTAAVGFGGRMHIADMEDAGEEESVC